MNKAVEASETLVLLVADERRTKTAVLERLAEMHVHRWHEELGYGSLFLYCTQRLGLAKASAFRRAKAAKLIARWPALVEYLRDGRMNVTTVCELGDVLTDENVAATLERAAGMNEDQVKRLAIELGGSEMEPVEQSLTPTGDGLHRLVMTVSDEFVSELHEVRDALSHKLPSGAFAEVMRECFRVTMAECAKRKRGAGPGVIDQITTSDGRYIPTAVRWQVWERDGGRCGFTSSDGHTCGSKWQLEFDHEIAKADRGLPTVDNIRLACRAHNQYRAAVRFGEARVRRAR